MVICLERGADLHTAQLMPLPLTVSCSSKIQIGLPFWYRLTQVFLEKRPLNGCCCLSLELASRVVTGENWPSKQKLSSIKGNVFAALCSIHGWNICRDANTSNECRSDESSSVRQQCFEQFQSVPGRWRQSAWTVPVQSVCKA